MYNVSDAYIEAVSRQTRTDKITVEIFSADMNLQCILTDEDIAEGTLTVSRQCVNNSYFEFGTAYASQLQFQTRTNKIAQLSVVGDYMRVTYSLLLDDDGSYEDVPVGMFRVTECEFTKGLRKITAYDCLVTLDWEGIAFESTEAQSPYDMLQYALWANEQPYHLYGMSVITVELGNSQEEIEAMPNGTVPLYLPDDMQTPREILSAVAELLGCFIEADKTTANKIWLRQFRSECVRTINPNIRFDYSVSQDWDRARDVSTKIAYQDDGSQISAYDYVAQGNGMFLLTGGYRMMMDNKFLNIARETSAKQITDSLAAELSRINQEEYLPISFSFFGDPAIDVGDMVECVYNNTRNPTLIGGYVWNYRNAESITAIGGNKSTDVSQSSSGLAKTVSNMQGEIEELKRSAVGVGETYYVDGVAKGEIFNVYTPSSVAGRESNVASGSYSHAEGYYTDASGNFSHTEGCYATASGSGAHAEGYSTAASGSDAHAEGCSTTAAGDYSHAEGYSTTASNLYAHAEGNGTTASGSGAHAEGCGTTALHHYTHAEGCYTKASSMYQHVQGKYNVEDTDGKYAFIIGNGTSNAARSNAFAVDWNGLVYINNAETGINLNTLPTQAVSVASTNYATLSISNNKISVTSACGMNTSGKSYAYNSSTYSGSASAEIHNDYTTNEAGADYAFVCGSDNHVFGNCGFAAGWKNTIAPGANQAAVIGESNTVKASCGIAIGYCCEVQSNNSLACGNHTIASGMSSHAEGMNTLAAGSFSHAEGAGTTASSLTSHAEGRMTTASGNDSHAEGYCTIASSECQHVQGRYNVEDADGKYAFIIGNGTSANARSNAFAVDWDGKIYIDNAETGINLDDLLIQVVALEEKIGNGAVEMDAITTEEIDGLFSA